jgi:hypothetical protein
MPIYLTILFWLIFCSSLIILNISKIFCIFLPYQEIYYLNSSHINDLFSSGFQRTYESVAGLQGSLEGINAAGLGGLQTNLSEITSALEGINPANLEGIGDNVAALNQPLGDVQTSLTG